MAVIMDGKALARKTKESVKKDVNDLKAKGVIPGLAVIIVGENPSSRIYVDSKKKDCSEAGIYSEEITLGENITQEHIRKVIIELNERQDIHGILLQLPLPKHLKEKELLELISPEKDVDGFHPVNIGRLLHGQDGFVSCTPAGVMEFFKEYNINIEGKECVIVGRSNIVGKPQAFLMLKENATVTICHSKTKKLKEICKRADIIVAAVGNPRFITGEMVKEGAVVIDVGINRIPESKKIVGDVDFESVVDKASYITPVPGGVGLMTRAMLLKNTIKACKKITNY